jgi:hypothetical protein
LPIGDYEWAADPIEAYRQALRVTDDSNIGFMLEIDAEIDQADHYRFNDLPPLPVRQCTSQIQ